MDSDGSDADADTVPADSQPRPESSTLPVAVVTMKAPDRWVERYKLGEVLGAGGMGEVLAARDEQIGRSVAVKRMRAEAPSPEAIARFLREARVQGRLEHPAIVPVHEVGRDDSGRPYFVMKQLAGVTLEHVLRTSEGATVRQRLLRAFAEVCLAVELAHTRGVIHRDLKPSNIMLGDFGEVYVLDWGIAHIAGDRETRDSFSDIDTLEGNSTRAGAVMGTPGYMSPEQAVGESVDARSDIFSLGKILKDIIKSDPAPELAEICAKATEHEPAQRYPTARSLGDAVQRFLDGDRDLELRRQLASTELEAAQRALADDDRTAAMRASARALALDPKARGPAELVARLMIEPPAQIPPEVELELEDEEKAMQRAQVLRGSNVMLLGLGFIPVLYWVGIRPSFIGIYLGLIVASIFTLRAYAARQKREVGWLSLIVFFGITALTSRALTPFLVAPGVALTIALVFALHPPSKSGHYATVPSWVLWTGLMLAVLGPWFLELAGVLSPTTTIDDHRMVLVPIANAVDANGVYFGLIVVLAATLLVGVGFPRMLSKDRRAMQRTIKIQSWQLRQLVPDASRDH